MATTLSITPATAANEGNSGIKAFTFTVTRSGTLTGASSAMWSVAGTGSNPASASDFSGGVLPAGVVNFAAGQSTATVTVNVSGDTVGENDEGFSVTLYNPVGATLGTSSVGTNLNQSASGGYGVTENFYNISGSGGTFTLDYDMYGIPDEAQIYVNGQLAVKTNGQVSYDGSLTIPATYQLSAGDVVKVVMIGTDYGTAWDYSVYYTGGIQTIDYIASSFIINDDGPVLAPQSTLSIEQPAPLNEGNSGPTPMVFTVKRTGDLSAAASAQWSVTGTGNAPADSADFVGGAFPSGIVNFTPGQSTATVTVNVNGDTTPESNEAFTVTLSNPVGATLGSSNVSTTLTQTASGGYGITEKFYNISGGGGSFSLKYEMYGQPDQAQIFVNGNLAATTNSYVSNAGTLVVPSTISLNTGDLVKVVMTGRDPGTLWDYTVNYTGGIQTIDYLASGIILNDDKGLPMSKLDDFVVLQPASAQIVGAGAGNDTYLISQHMLPAGIDLTISDAKDANSIQLNNGLKIASFQVTSNALKLTLDTGASVTILGADKFTYDPGANSTVGINNADLSYANFVSSILGKTVPTTGTVNGGPITIGSPTLPTSPVSGNGTFNATSAADIFYFDAVTALLDAAGTNTQAKISGFSTAIDSLRIDLPMASSSITNLSQLNGQQGVVVQVDPFSNSILVNFGNDANGGEITSLTLMGVTDPSLVQIAVV